MEAALVSAARQPQPLKLADLFRSLAVGPWPPASGSIASPGRGCRRCRASQRSQTLQDKEHIFQLASKPCYHTYEQGVKKENDDENAPQQELNLSPN